jgi:hypothetical protein
VQLRAKKRKKVGRKPGKMRVQCCFTLSTECLARITAMAHELGLSRSKAFEELVTPDFPMIFQMFKDGKSFDDMVIQSGCAPALLRHLWRERKMGLDGKPVPVELEQVRVSLQELKNEGRYMRETTRERIARVQASAEKFVAEAKVREERARALAPKARGTE